MQVMIKEQGIQGEKIAKLESVPGKAYNNMKRARINSFVSAFAGAFATGIIIMMEQLRSRWYD